MREAPHVLGIVLAGGEGKRLYPLTADRAKPAVPFGGAYRLIDFVLSNLVNARFLRICVLTQYKSHSLDRHISQNWRLSGLAGEYITPVPAQQRLGPRWYTGSADAIYQSMNLIYDEDPDYIVIFGADHVYRMDPEQMVQQHIESGAGATVAGIRVPRAEASAFGCIDADDSGRIRGWVEKPAEPPGTPDDPEQTFVSMGNYIFTTKVLIDAIRADAEDDDSDHDMGGDIIPRLVSDGMASVYDFNNNEVPGATERDHGYWRDVGTLDAFYDAHMDLVSVHPIFNLYNKRWPIRGELGEPRARQVRQRRIGAGVRRRRGQHHLGRVGAQLGAVVQRRRRRRRDRRGQRDHARRPDRPRRGGAPRDPGQERRRRARRDGRGGPGEGPGTVRDQRRRRGGGRQGRLDLAPPRTFAPSRDCQARQAAGRRLAARGSDAGTSAQVERAQARSRPGPARAAGSRANTSTTLTTSSTVLSTGAATPAVATFATGRTADLVSDTAQRDDDADDDGDPLTGLREGAGIGDRGRLCGGAGAEDDAAGGRPDEGLNGVVDPVQGGHLVGHDLDGEQYGDDRHHPAVLQPRPPRAAA